jgi:hypothetical protein
VAEGRGRVIASKKRRPTSVQLLVAKSVDRLQLTTDN